MIIYKITNTINGKCYIGQTIRTLEERWTRHQRDALNNNLDTHFAGAIRKYGVEAFTAEIIDTAETQEELTKKESEWIKKLDTINNGYNETDAEYKCGGNTYKNKTQEELAIIGQKIRESKLGGNNPQATGVKCKNIKTNEELHFNSQAEMRDYFNESNHQFVSRRCLGITKVLYKGEWLIAFENNDYPTDYTFESKGRKKAVKITDKTTTESKIFSSLTEAGSYIGCDRKMVSKIANGTKEHPKYKVEFL